jgi:hypothetical protein
MRPNSSEWTIVLVGSWNTAILNPEWLSKNVLDTEEIEIELAVLPAGPAIRYLTKTLLFNPATDRVVIAPRIPTEGALESAEQAATKLLSALPVTPLSACGVNFGYRVLEPSAEIALAFNISDSAKIAQRGWTVISTSITRTITYNNRVLNCRLSQNTDGSIDFRFNYHSSVNSAEAAEEAVAHSTSLMRHSLEFMQAVYGLELEDEEDDS